MNASLGSINHEYKADVINVELEGNLDRDVLEYIDEANFHFIEFDMNHFDELFHM